MEGLLDRTSPRRGSLNSLHRQSSGSISSVGHNSKYATNNSSNSTGSSSLTSATQCPDLDKYTRYFIIKAVQIIVQSRIGGNKEIRTECKPHGNDWFNINLTDVAEISERTKAAIDSEGVSLKYNWRVCCEISLKTGDETRVVLEQWYITNRTISMTVPPNSVVGSPSANNISNISHVPKISQQQKGPSNDTNTSTTSNSKLSNSHYQTQAPSSIYTIYNRMTLLLKTLMTTAHIVPAFRLASKVNRPSVICYRVYTVTPSSSCQNLAGSGSPMKNDIIQNNCTNRSDEMIKKCEPAEDDIDQHFGPILKLSSIKTETNELSICYRTDVNSSNHLLGSPRAREKQRNYWEHGKISSGGATHNEDCLMAAKQLLSGNGKHSDQDRRCNSNDNFDHLDQPLLPAFASRIASTPPASTNNLTQYNNVVDGINQTNKLQDQYGELLESAFDSLVFRNGDESISEVAINLQKPKHRNGCERSANIQVPKSDNINHHHSGRRNSKSKTNQPSSGSTPKSLSDSFVFVDINPPFASEEQNDINSFFHGPSPSFSNGFDSLKDVDELTNQLATIEANASQIDDFVDTICASENEEDYEE